VRVSKLGGELLHKHPHSHCKCIGQNLWGVLGVGKLGVMPFFDTVLLAATVGHRVRYYHHNRLTT